MESTKSRRDQHKGFLRRTPTPCGDMDCEIREMSVTLMIFCGLPRWRQRHCKAGLLDVPSDRLFLGTHVNTQSRLEYWLWSCLQRLLNNMYMESPHPCPALSSAISSLFLPMLLPLYHCQEGILPKMHINAQNKQGEGEKKRVLVSSSFHFICSQASTTGTWYLLWRRMCKLPLSD